MARRRSRWTWVLLAAAGVYAAAYAASARWGLTVSPSQRLGIGVAAGALVLEDRWGSSMPTATGGFRPTKQHSLLYPFRHRFGFVWWYRATVQQPIRVLPLLPPGLPLAGPAGPSYRSIKIPLWMPLAPLMLILGLVMMIRRRIPPGHCRGCRYDLRGVPGPVCPECGRATGAAGPALKEPGPIPQ